MLVYSILFHSVLVYSMQFYSGLAYYFLFGHNLRCYSLTIHLLFAMQYYPRVYYLGKCFRDQRGSGSGLLALERRVWKLGWYPETGDFHTLTTTLCILIFDLWLQGPWEHKSCTQVGFVGCKVSLIKTNTSYIHISLLCHWIWILNLWSSVRCVKQNKDKI